MFNRSTKNTQGTHTHNPVTFHAVTVGKLIVEKGDLKRKGRAFFHICNFLNIVKIKRIFKILDDWLGNVPYTKWALRTHWMLSCDVVFFALLWFFRKYISSNWRYSSHMEKRARTVSFLEMLVHGRVNTYAWGVRMVAWHTAVPFTGDRNWALFPWELQLTGK